MAQRYSQNGWKAETTARNFTRFQACGEGWWAANDDVAVVFTEFIERFNAEVEPVYQRLLDDWSYANRLIRGSSTVVSNHGSGTAIDINATKHPLGTRTLSAKKLKAMRRIKDEITDDAGRPVLRLGADYTGRPDEMHIEIDADAARVKQAANKLRARNKAQEDDGMATITPDEFATLFAKAKLRLSSAAARQLSKAGVPHKEGDLVSLSYFLQWGGPGLSRQFAQLESLTAQVGALSKALTALAAGSASDVSDAFAQGIADLEAAAENAVRDAVSDHDLKLVVDDDADEPAP